MSAITIEQNQPHDGNIINKLMLVCTSHQFRFLTKILLIIYSVVLAHAAVTGHKFGAVDWLVMFGLLTTEITLVSVSLQVILAKVDSKDQQTATIATIVLITLFMGVNAIVGLSVLHGNGDLLPEYRNYVIPVLPVVAFGLLMFVEGTSYRVQDTITAAVADAEMKLTKRKSDLDIQKAQNKLELDRAELEAEIERERIQTRIDLEKLELAKTRAETRKEIAQLEARTKIAENEAEVLAEVAKKGAEVRKVAMFEFLDSEEFVKKSKRTAKKDALTLIEEATAVSTGTANAGTAGNG